MCNEKNNYEILLKKKMHCAEISHNWIYMPSKIRDVFTPGTVVRVKVGQKKMHMRINSNNYMVPETALWDRFLEAIDFDKYHDILVFIRHKDGTLEIASEKRGKSNGSS